MSEEHENEEKPRVGIFYCGGAMSSAGELTGVAAFEVLDRLGPQEVGMGCVSALAAGVPKHFRTMQGLERVVVIDGCPNACARKIVKKDGRPDGRLHQPGQRPEDQEDRPVQAVGLLPGRSGSGGGGAPRRGARGRRDRQ